MSRAHVRESRRVSWVSRTWLVSIPANVPASGKRAVSPAGSVAMRTHTSRSILAERQPRGIGEQHGLAYFDRESSPNRKPAVHHVWRLSEGPRLARRDRQGVARGVWTCRLAATERQHRSAGYERGSHSEVYTATRRAEPQEEGARRCCHCRMQGGPPKRRARDTPVASTPHGAAPAPTNSAEPRVPTPANAVRRLHPESAGHEDAACCAGRRAGGGVSLRQAVQ